jgi:hypothetical protein
MGWVDDAFEVRTGRRDGGGVNDEDAAVLPAASALTMRCLAGCGAVFGIIVARALTDLLGFKTVLGGMYVIGGVYLLLDISPKHGGLSSWLFLLDEKLKCVAVGVSAIPSDAIAARSNCQSDMSNLFLCCGCGAL